MMWIACFLHNLVNVTETLRVPDNNCVVMYHMVASYSCTTLSAGQLTRLMLSINGVCKCCQGSNGTIMWETTTWDGQPGNHTFRLLSKHSISPCSATLHECQTKQMPRRS